MDIQQTLQGALANHQAGQLQQAEAGYRQVLQAQPNNADALHLLGVIAHQVGQHQPAAELIGRAIALNPGNAAFYNNMGEALRALGRFDEAGGHYQRAIQLDPNQADAWSNLSLIFRASNRMQDAAAAARRAVEIRPNFANGHLNLGTSLVDADPEAAFQALVRAAQIDPNLPSAHCNIGLLLTRVGRNAEAIESCNRALALQPDFIEALVNLSLAYINSERLEEAADAAHRVLKIDPKCSMAFTNLGLAMSQLRRHDEALDALRHALDVEPNNPVFHKNLGVGYVKAGRLRDARDAFEKSLALDPNYAEGHFNLAMSLLTLGDFERGWAEYEWRWRFEPFLKANPRNLPNPWTSQDLAGKTIVLAYEQGFGDSIQFIRYAPILADRGANVVVFCPAILHSVVKTVTGVSAVYAPATPPPPCDYQVNMLSIPHVMKTTLETIPNTVPYISADPEKVAAWRDRLKDDKNFKVGLCWTGNPKHFNDRLRSIPPEMLSPLSKIDGITFYSLQKQPADGPPIKFPDFPLVDHTAEIQDFSDTAALMMHLDLVITVDTSVAHLAGALARPVWSLIPIGPDFRWMLDRSDSPWYPTLKLYRQPVANDWPDVLGRVTADLTSLVAAKSG